MDTTGKDNYRINWRAKMDTTGKDKNRINWRTKMDLTVYTTDIGNTRWEMM